MNPSRGTILVEVSAGELLDKISVLRIKAQRIKDPAKLANVNEELRTLEATQAKALVSSTELNELVKELTSVNITLWEVIENIYACESEERGWEAYVELARSVYIHNDKRALLKRKINLLVGSRLFEEKGHDIGA